MNTKREQILKLVREYYIEEFKEKETEFKEGDRIGYGGRYFDQDELENLVNASLDFWLTTGRYASEFEREFAKFLGLKFWFFNQLRIVCQFVGFYDLDISEIEGETK